MPSEKSEEWLKNKLVEAGNQFQEQTPSETDHKAFRQEMFRAIDKIASQQQDILVRLRTLENIVHEIRVNQ